MKSAFFPDKKITRELIESLMPDYLHKVGRVHKITPLDIKHRKGKFNKLGKWEVESKRKPPIDIPALLRRMA